MKKLGLFPFFILLFLTACLKEYKLEWKVPTSGIYYRTLMEPVDVEKSKIKIFNNSKDTMGAEKMLNQTLSGIKDLIHYSILKPENDSLIDYTMVSYLPKQNKDIRDLGLGYVFSSMLQGKTLEGKINKSGKIKNNLIQSKQGFLIPLFLQLPDYPVKKGDKWKLDVKLIETGYGVKIEKSKEENEVQVLEIKQRNDTLIAFLRYNIFSSVEGKFQNFIMPDTMKALFEIGFKGDAEFDIERGKWIMFDGILSSKSSGILSTNEKLHLQLIEIAQLPQQAENLAKGLPVELDSNLYNQVKHIIDTMKVTEKKEKPKSDTLKREKNESIPPKKLEEKKIVDCPVIYSVQIMAAKEKIPLTSLKFKGINGQIYEVNKPNEIYSFKYQVGKECSRNDALKIKERLQKQGFPGAFIIKESNQ